jgi:hypothetical protein
MIKKTKTIILYLFTIILFTNAIDCNADNLSPKEKHALQLINAIQQIRYISEETIVNQKEIVYDNDGKFKMQYYEKTSIHPSMDGNFDQSIIQVSLEYMGGNLSGATIKTGKCGTAQHVQFYFNGDVIVKANFLYSDYTLAFDTKGNLIKATSGSARNSDYIVKKEFRVSYDDNDNITKVEEYTIKGKGKSPRDVKKFFTYINLSKSYDQSPDENTTVLTLKGYKNKYKEKEDDVLRRDETVTIHQTEKEVNFEFYDNLKSKKATEYINKFDEKNRLISRTYTSFLYQYLEIYEYEYNEKGWCIKETKKSYNPDKTIKIHEEYFFNYKLIEGKDAADECSYKKSIDTDKFNSQGELIEQRKDGKMRRKNENGQWGEWQFMRY